MIKRLVGLVQPDLFWKVTSAALVLGAALRLWGPFWGQPAWHPDEFNFVYWPLLFFEGDLNPDVFYYPHFLYYILALIYGAYFAAVGMGSGLALDQWAALHYFWRADAVLLVGRTVCALFGAGTVVWVALIARRCFGPQAGMLAGLCAAVSVLAVRQAPLAAADVPMTFFFCATIWAALRLREAPTYRAYLLAGLFVGLAAATKYNGAVGAAAVLAAHGRRSPFDARLWAAGLVSCLVFAAASPYVLIDFAQFSDDLAAVAQHTATGRDDLGPAWWYHIHFTLRHNLGWLGGGLTLIGIAAAWRRPQGRILLVAFIAYYLAISAGRLVFVRYAVPGAALQCALAAGALLWLGRHRFGIALAGLALLEPLYGSARVAQLLAAPDTRAAARQWLETQVPSGRTLGNFGGWAGDVQLETFEHLWWRVRHYERNVGYPRLEEHLSVFEQAVVLPPHYHYAIQFGNRQHLPGSMGVVDEFACSHVVLHRHRLGYSNVDSAFAAALARSATRLAHFAPAGLSDADPAYDPIDAYYIPLGAFGALRQAGPDIEIWRVGAAKDTAPRRLGPRQALGAAYMSGAGSALDQGDPLGFQRLAARALALDPGLDDARYRLKAGDAQRRLDRPRQAIAHWQRAAELDPDWADPLYNMGLVYRYDLGDEQAALSYWRRALANEADHLPSHGQLAATLRHRGDYRQAAAHWQRVVEIDPHHADAFYNLGLIFRYDLQDTATALAFWRRAVALDGAHWDARYNLALLLHAGGENDEALAHWRRAVDLRPDHPQGHNGLGATYKALGRYGEAAAAWQKAVRLAPDYATAHFNLGLVYLYQLDRPADAKVHLRRVLALRPDHPQAAQIQAVLGAR